MRIIPRWYRFLYWRLYTWYRDWKRLDPFMSAVSAAGSGYGFSMP